MAERIDDPMLFDWGEFWDSDDVQLMSADEVIAYQRLLSCQWRDGDLPEDPRLLALKASSGVRQFTVGEFVGSSDGPGPPEEPMQGTIDDPACGSIWEALKPCFEIYDGVRHLRVACEREAWLAKKAMYSARGKAARAAQAGNKTTIGDKKPTRSRQEAGNENDQAGSLSPPSPCPDPSPGEERKPQKASSSATSSADGADADPPEVLDEDEVAIWLPMVRGRKACDELRVRVSPLDGDEEEWAIMKTDVEAYGEAYPDIDVDRQLARLFAWLRSNKPKRKTPSGMLKFLNSWMDRAQNSGGGNGSGPGSRREGGRVIEPIPDKPLDHDDPRYYTVQLKRGKSTRHGYNE